MKAIKKLLTLGAVLLFAISSGACDVRGQNLADLVIRAETDRRPIPRLSAKYPGMDLPMAYDLQRACIRKRPAISS